MGGVFERAVPIAHVDPAAVLEADSGEGADVGHAEAFVEADAGGVGEGDAGEEGSEACGVEAWEEGGVEAGRDASGVGIASDVDAEFAGPAVGLARFPGGGSGEPSDAVVVDGDDEGEGGCGEVVAEGVEGGGRGGEVGEAQEDLRGEDVEDTAGVGGVGVEHVDGVNSHAGIVFVSGGGE